MDERRSGLQTIKPLHDGIDIIPDGSATVYEGHRWNVRNVGEPLIGMADSSDGIEILRHEKKNIYAMQFHPEVYRDNNGKELFERIVSRMGLIE